MKFKKHNGFSLIEMLVVISIIAILASIALISFAAAQKQARDTQRKSDIKQYQTSLESFASRSASANLYPSKITNTETSTLCTTLNLSNCPSDPRSPSHDYFYISDGSGIANDATKYVLSTYLESAQSYWIVCSSGKTGTSVDLPADSACPI